MRFFSKKEKNKAGKKKPAWREWLDAGVFALIAATIIRTFIAQIYVFIVIWVALPCVLL